jgi:O-6-methylguanine DNA methyltransferase
MSIERALESLMGSLPEGVSEGIALGTGLAEGYDVYESPVGEVVVTFNPQGVSSVDLADPEFADRFLSRFGRRLLRAEPPRAWGRYIPEAIEAGTPGRLPVDLRSVTPFREEVLRATAMIPKGEVRAYSWVAAEVHRPKAVRAVGSAVANNPIPLIIPCHRVVRADGSVGKYSLGGPHNKRLLLAEEGADPNWLDVLAAEGVRVMGNKTTKIACHPTCRHARASKPENLVVFESLEAAETAGYRPCLHCRPR